MSSEDVRDVFTCGVCEEVCENIAGHPCIENYNNIGLDDNNYFYPMLDNEGRFILRGMLPDGREGLIIDSDKENCPQNSQSTPTTKPPAATLYTPKCNQKKLDENEQLLLEIQKRIPLWNFQIPLKERSKEIQARLWKEVSEALNGKLNAVEVRIKFKNLRDTYRRIIRSERRSSGSAAGPSQESWKYYKCCEFLRDSCLSKKTSTNASTGEEENSDNEVTNDSFSDTFDEDLRSQAGVAGPSRKRRHSNKEEAVESTSALNRIADALCREVPPLAMPEPPKLDTVGAFLMGLGNQIRQLPESIQMDILKKFTDIVYDEIKKKR